jgi:hypothetical protein
LEGGKVRKTISQKQNANKGYGGMSKVLKHLPSKPKTMCSIPSAPSLPPKKLYSLSKKVESGFTVGQSVDRVQVPNYVASQLLGRQVLNKIVI